MCHDSYHFLDLSLGGGFRGIRNSALMGCMSHRATRKDGRARSSQRLLGGKRQTNPGLEEETLTRSSLGHLQSRDAQRPQVALQVRERPRASTFSSEEKPSTRLHSEETHGATWSTWHPCSLGNQLQGRSSQLWLSNYGSDHQETMSSCRL